jgi:hypothetical protein
MRFSTFSRFSARNSGPVLAAVTNGLARLGQTVSDHDESADVAVIWSRLWSGRMANNKPIVDAFRSTGRPIIIVEVGVLDRNQTWQISVDQQIFSTHEHDSTRAQQLGLQLRPWHGSGQSILIAMQNPKSDQWHGQPPLDDWLTQTVSQLRTHTDRSIEVRPHPRFPLRSLPTGCVLQTPRHLLNTYDSYDFEQACDRAWAVINVNSHPGIVSILRGTPAFVHASSWAAPAANTDLSLIENPRRPDRTQWLNDLAWTEWSLDELSSGTALQETINGLQNS